MQCRYARELILMTQHIVLGAYSAPLKRQFACRPLAAKNIPDYGGGNSNTVAEHRHIWTFVGDIQYKHELYAFPGACPSCWNLDPSLLAAG